MTNNSLGNMNIDPSLNVENKAEKASLSFENYEYICNFSNDSSRRRGILSSEMYDEIVNDVNTDFIDSVDSHIPVLMDIKYGLAMGYDPEKCRRYAENLADNMKILTLPFHELNDNEKIQVANLLKSNGKTSIYFSDHNDDESNALRETMSKMRIRYKEKPLIDSRAKAGDEQAALFMYSCSTEQTGELGERHKLNLKDVFDYYNKNRHMFEDRNDEKSTTLLIMGDMVTNEQADDMWELYNDRFDFLGENHPISMQDSKSDFLELLRSESTIIASTYVRNGYNQDKLVCFTYFIDDMSKLYWLNHSYLMGKFAGSAAAQDLTTNIFTPGIVSSGVGASYSPRSIGLFARVCDESGLSSSVLYENTNLSKSYIPRIVDRAIGASCDHMVLNKSKIVDKVIYRLWTLESNDGE